MYVQCFYFRLNVWFDYLIMGTVCLQISPSPSPVPSANSDSGDVESPGTLPNGETCDKVSNKCDIQDFSFTACVPFVGNGNIFL